MKTGRWLPGPCAVLAGLPLLLLAAPLRHALESRMAWHMLVEFPALLLGGLAWRRLAARRARGGAAGRGLDAQGWIGATFLSAVAALWMVPTMLDLSLLHGGIALAKNASWWLAGGLLGTAWPRMALEARLFLLGNLAWMTATAGLLYRESPQRLCVNYLVGDQQQAGTGLVALAVALVGLAVALSLRPPRRTARQERRAVRRPPPRAGIATGTAGT